MKLFIFGSTGDLIKRKAIPALQNLGKDGLEICALGRQDIIHEDYRDHVCEGDRCTREFRNKIKYRKIDFEKEDICDGVCINIFDRNETNYIYISLPPHLIEKTLKSVVKFKEDGFDLKILIEKPFGDSSITALNLKNFIEKNNLVDDVFLNDHYLFKKFEADYPKDFKSMKIVSHEDVGLEGRVGYYDSVGALKDMVQSHFMNIVFGKLDSIENEFEDFEVIDFRRGQYRGYKEELGNESDTETFVYLKLKTKNKIFEFVTGKAMGKKEFYVEVDGSKINVDSVGDYERLFEEFFNHSQEGFAKIDRSVFSWELIEKLVLGSKDLFYYEQGSSLEDIEHNLIN